MMAAGGGGAFPTEGLVFHASFRDVIAAETGQTLANDGGCELAADSDLGRNFCRIECGVLSWSDLSGFPVGSEPFTLSVLAKIDENSGGTVVFGWGSTPTSPTVATLALDGEGNICPCSWGPDTIFVHDPGGWHHWCFTHAGGDVNVHCDGELIRSDVMTFNIGVGKGAFGTWWTGHRGVFGVANARIYNRALSSAEVKALAKEV